MFTISIEKLKIKQVVLVSNFVSHLDFCNPIDGRSQSSVQGIFPGKNIMKGYISPGQSQLRNWESNLQQIYNCLLTSKQFSVTVC